MFKSFYRAGFECSTGRNVHGEWIDQLAATEHDRRADADYAMLSQVGIHTVREGVRWPLVDRGHGYDFSSLDAFVLAARRHQVEVIWDLFHFGYPERLDPFDPKFGLEFARYCTAVARHLCGELPGPFYFTPVNEGSYFAWAAGEKGLFAPHAQGRGAELKVNLARAAVLGVRAIREVCPAARFVTADPICSVVPPVACDGELSAAAQHFNHSVVFEFMDMLAGRLRPDLGGSRDCLDIVGLNYYATNQWVLGHEGNQLGEHDPRRLPIGALVRRAAQRYGGPIIVSETGASDDGRAPWLDEISEEALSLLGEGIGFSGVCLYPILGMPEWHDQERWARMGLWDLERSANGLERVPHRASLRALEQAKHALHRQRIRSSRPPAVEREGRIRRESSA
jgi:hypothetical protein